jgi:hypothetical protein
MVTDYGEPIEMHLKLKYIPLDDSFVIFGSAFNIEDDILLRLCETENQVYKNRKLSYSGRFYLQTCIKSMC